MALPGWQALHQEFADQGLTIITVAMDVLIDQARPWMELATPTHPSLWDPTHQLAARLGIINVPMAVWFDETGMLVRPAEQASIEESAIKNMEVPAGLPERMAEQFALAKALPSEPGAYRAAIADWVAHGSASRFALSADEVVARSGGRSIEHAEAVACFEMGQYLFEHVSHEAAQPWWKRAHQLHPEHWTYKRQAWTLVTTPDGQPSDLMQGPNEVYDGNWVDDLKALGGPERYYPTLQL
jgi:hypothetical protein